MTGPWRVDEQTGDETTWFATEEAAKEYAAELKRRNCHAYVMWCDWADYEGEGVA